MMARAVSSWTSRNAVCHCWILRPGGEVVSGLVVRA